MGCGVFFCGYLNKWIVWILIDKLKIKDFIKDL